MEAELQEFKRLMQDFVECCVLWVATMEDRVEEGERQRAQEYYREFVRFWQQQN